jgi:hypothetical protein
VTVTTPAVGIAAKTASSRPPFRVRVVNLNGSDVG